LTRLMRRINLHRTTDLYFVGYPRTGNTWTRFVLGKYIESLCGLPYQPFFEATDSLGRCERACVGPAMQFTHRPLEWSSQTPDDLDYHNVIQPFTNKAVVLIVRNPLDTLVSSWFSMHRDIPKNERSKFAEFLEDPIRGLGKYVRFYSLWHRGSVDVKRFRLVRYEDLQRDSFSVFLDLLRFLEIPVDVEKLRSAIESGSFDNMRRIQLSGNVPAYRSSDLTILWVGDPTDNDTFHVRAGKVNGFLDYLSEKDASRYEQRVEPQLLDWLGYERGPGGNIRY
jgi:sulfotransferase family protein